MGPISADELESLAHGGVIGNATPVRLDGEDVWQPYGGLHVAPESGPVTSPPLPTAFPCSRCGEGLPRNALLTYREEDFCGPCKVDYFQHVAQGTLTPHFVPNLFVKRALAKAIDVNILLTLLLSVVMTMDSYDVAGPYQALVALGGVLAYSAYVVCSTARYGATLGKRVLRLHVIQENGVPLGYTLSLGRAMATVISMVCLFGGFVLALADPERRTLHDRICHTRVVPMEP